MKNNLNETALHEASWKGHLDIVKLLLKHDADVNVKAKLKLSALHFASYKGYLDIAKLLLKHGANVNTKSLFIEETALHIASRENHLDIVKLLLQNGANVQIKDNKGRTSFDYAIQKGNKELIELFNTSKCMKAFKSN